jgi:hypothetical protein
MLAELLPRLFHLSHCSPILPIRRAPSTFLPP